MFNLVIINDFFAPIENYRFTDPLLLLEFVYKFIRNTQQKLADKHIKYMLLLAKYYSIKKKNIVKRFHPR